MRVVVFGATGVVGRALLPLLATEHEVVGASRRAEAGEEKDADGVLWVPADVADARPVAAALTGAEVVYYLVHSLGWSDFAARDREGAAVVSAEAERAGARQIVYLGGLGDESEDLSPHLASRRETERVLAGGNVPVTTLRAAMLVGAGSAAFETIVALVKRLPAMLLPRWASTPTQPIALSDAARYLAAVCGREETFGETYDIGGPEVMTYREMIERIARLRGRRPPLVEVPVLSPRLSALWLELVNPKNAAVARPLVEGLRNPTVVHDERIRELVPFQPTRFDDAAREALAA